MEDDKTEYQLKIGVESDSVVPTDLKYVYKNEKHSISEREAFVEIIETLSNSLEQTRNAYSDLLELNKKLRILISKQCAMIDDLVLKQKNDN